MTDGSGGYGRGIDIPRQFHLGEFVQVLETTTWDGFDIQITKAHRRSPANAAVDVPNFTFTDASLGGFDMALLFAVERDQPAFDITDAEVAAIARFMDQGGGVFATGDHEDLGAAMCRKIPRVSSMRRWHWPSAGPNGEPVAPIGTPVPPTDPTWPSLKDRLDTLRPGADTVYDFDDQSDRWAQPIDPTYYWGLPFKQYPHPLLCSPLGAVDRLPDHPHEGLCEVPGDLTRTVAVGGYSTIEYPLLGGAPLAPEVVATATVIGGHTTVNPNKPVTVGRTFGVIGAWDGHSVGRGRVVVDATWHHFFNVNLIGDGTSPNPAKHQGFYAAPQPNSDYEKIKWYFRNIVYWLIPADRIVLWFQSVATYFQYSPFLLQEAPRFPRKLDLGWTLLFAGLADHYFSTVRGACWRLVLPEILELQKELFWWETLKQPVRGFGDTDDAARPLHPLLTVHRSVLSDLALGALVGVTGRWARQHPEEEVTSEVVELLTREALTELIDLTSELREHLQAVRDEVDDLDRLLG